MREQIEPRDGDVVTCSLCFARATAQGVEMIDLFERPVAFGFEPLSEPLDVRRGTDGEAVFPPGQNGIDEFCRDFGAIR